MLRAFREGGVTPTSNLVFFFDGEEEAGSRNLGRYLEMQAGKLDGIDPIGDEEQAALESIPDVDPRVSSSHFWGRPGRARPRS